MRLELIAVKSIIRRKKRALFLILRIVVAVLIVNTLYQLNASMNREIGDTYDRLGPNIIITPKEAQLALSYGGISLPTKERSGVPLIADDYMKVYQIHDRDSIAVVSPKLLDVGMVNQSVKATLLGVYFQFEEKLKPWWNWSGQLPFQEAEVLLGNKIALQLGANVNDQIAIEGKQFVVTGILDMLGSDEDHVIFMPLLSLQALKGHGEEISFIEVAALCTTCPLPEITEQIRQVLPHAEVKGLQEAVELRKNTVERIQEFMIAGSIVIIVISCLVVGMSMMNYVFARKAEIGILRAVGLRRLHVFEVLLTESVVIGLIGGIFGYLSGTLLAKYLTPFVVTLPLTIEYSGVIFGISVLVTMVLTTLASLIPIYRVTALDPVEALRL